MSKQQANAAAKSRAKTAAPIVELGAEPHTPMRGCDIVVKCLEREGVDTVFAYPGGASMELHQALTRSKHIRTILPRHEQGGAFAADGYARACGKTGVAIATSGPGATNLVTGVADAYMDSIPLVLITGQVPRAMIGKGAFQETDVFGLALPIVKHSYLVMNVEDIPRVFKEAFYIANTGRPGPVWIDIPKDVPAKHLQAPVFTDKINLRGYNPDKRISDIAVNEIAGLIEKSERAGHLRGRRHYFVQERRQGTGRVRRESQYPRRDDVDGRRGDSVRSSVVHALARDARHGVRELCGR